MQSFATNFHQASLMLEILVVMAAVAVAIGAAHRRRRRGRALIPIKFQTEVDLAGLAENVATTIVTTAALEQDFDVISTDLLVALRDQTVGIGPIEFGLAMQDYTGPEIVEAVDASPLSQYGTEMERSSRKVRTYGQFSGELVDETVNDGVPIRRKMFLRVPAGKSAADVWFINRAAVSKTAGTAEITGVHWGRWK